MEKFFTVSFFYFIVDCFNNFVDTVISKEIDILMYIHMSLLINYFTL